MAYDIYSNNCGYCAHKQDIATCFATCKQCKNQSCFEPEHVCASCVHNCRETHGDIVACNICRIAANGDEEFPDNYEHIPMPSITFSEACKLMCAARKEAA